MTAYTNTAQYTVLLRWMRDTHDHGNSLFMQISHAFPSLPCQCPPHSFVPCTSLLTIASQACIPEQRHFRRYFHFKKNDVESKSKR